MPNGPVHACKRHWLLQQGSQYRGQGTRVHLWSDLLFQFIVRSRAMPSCTRERARERERKNGRERGRRESKSERCLHVVERQRERHSKSERGGFRERHTQRERQGDTERTTGRERRGERERDREHMREIAEQCYLNRLFACECIGTLTTVQRRQSRRSTGSC